MSNTPRTDAERAKTLTQAYEYEGAEWEAWEWARKLEKELIGLQSGIKDIEKLISDAEDVPYTPPPWGCSNEEHLERLSGRGTPDLIKLSDLF